MILPYRKISIAFYITGILTLVGCESSELKTQYESNNKRFLELKGRMGNLNEINKTGILSFESDLKQLQADVIDFNTKTNNEEKKHHNADILKSIERNLHKVEDKLYVFDSYDQTEKEVMRSVQGKWTVGTYDYKLKSIAHGTGVDYEDFQINDHKIIFIKYVMGNITSSIECKIHMDSTEYYNSDIKDLKDNNTRKGWAYYKLILENCGAADKYSNSQWIKVCFKDGKLSELTFDTYIAQSVN